MHSKYVTFGRIYLNLNGEWQKYHEGWNFNNNNWTCTCPGPKDTKTGHFVLYCIVFIFKYTYLIITETHCCMLKRGGSQYHVIT